MVLCICAAVLMQARMSSLEKLRRDVDKQRRTAEKKFKRHESRVSACCGPYAFLSLIKHWQCSRYVTFC